MDILERKFELVKKRLQKGVLNITEVYINHTQRTLVYRPIASVTFNELMDGRKRLKEQTNLQLAGVELELDRVVEVHPTRRRARGRFHLTEWLNPDFTVGYTPESVIIRKNLLEKNSGWLSGGPR